MSSPTPQLPHLFETFPEELHSWLAGRGIDANPEHCRRVIAEIVTRGRTELAPRRALARTVKAAVNDGTRRDRLEVVERVTDAAGFVKYLFRSPDGALTEAVRLPLAKEGCFSVCLSSQVGCAMGCVFCATGRLGLSRNLEAWEMVSAFLTVRDEAPGRVTGAVFQGQGEPFHNYDRVIRAARMLAHPCGGAIAAKAITISTVGLVPQIRRYTAEGHKFRLILSLTSVIADRRSELLPVAGKFAIEDLADALREHAAASSFSLQTVAWVVMSGVNTGSDEVEALKLLLGDLRMRINLIDVNDSRPDGFRPAPDPERHRFMDELAVLQMPLVRRYSGSTQNHAACGMLASKQTAIEEQP